MKAASNWICGPLAALALLSLGACLDAPSDAQAGADNLDHALTRARLVAGRDALAVRMCAAEKGTGATVVWNHDGDFTCRPPVQHLAKGGDL